MYWLNLSYWKYLLSECKGIKHFICRARRHPSGVIWFSSRLEPDMRCKNCHEDLG